MKYLQIAGIVVLPLMSFVVQAQDTTNAKTAPTDTKSIRSKGAIRQSEANKNKYKSKEWQQGTEVITDNPKESPGKPKAGVSKKPAKQPIVPTAPSTSPVKPPAR